MTSIKSILFFNILSFISLIPLASYAEITKRYEDGLAITHPRILRTLQMRANGHGIGLGYFFDRSGKLPPHLSNAKLSALAPYRVILTALKKEIASFKSSTEHPKYNTVGVGVQYHSRLFDTRYLNDERTAFSLVGIVNRMDQAYENPETCGETRLIYRLAYNVKVGEKSVSSRLPFTINLILHARPKDSTLTCREIAARWKALDFTGRTVSNSVDMIFANDGPLSQELRSRDLIKQVEVNLQLARKAAGVQPDFGGLGVYLLKVFKWDNSSQTLIESTLKNQVSLDKAEGFFNWLFQDSEHLRRLDDGTLLIPDEFLDTKAISITPGGLDRAKNHTLFQAIDDKRIEEALAKIPEAELLNIKSTNGFKRRLTDLSCTGCHQTRAIGGFHFMGEDPYYWSNSHGRFIDLYPGNTVAVPASAHFFSDLERRRRFQSQLLSDEAPNPATGFASKPYDNGKHKAELSPLGIKNGWGSHCYMGDDASFKDWSCAEGLTCKVLNENHVLKDDFGVCVSQGLDELGDPTEFGQILGKPGSWTGDKYVSQKITTVANDKVYLASPQSGGFPGGSIRLRTCENDVMERHEEALCGMLPAAGGGFNECIFNPKHSFDYCLENTVDGVGLRKCSRLNPCRDDYICVGSTNQDLENAGVCIPPYFLFQFRVDGHPVEF